MSAKAMTKSALFTHLAEKTELSKTQITQVFEELNSVATKEAKNGFTLPGFGKLVLQNRAARMGRNPQTGEAIKIKAKKVLKFRLAKPMKDSVLGLRA